MRNTYPCISCGGKNIIFSTEKDGSDWIWKKICASCSNELETKILEL